MVALLKCVVLLLSVLPLPGLLESHLTLLELYTSLQGDLPVLTAVANMVVRWKKDMPGWKDAAQV